MVTLEDTLYRLLRAHLGEYFDLTQIGVALGVDSDQVPSLLSRLTGLGAPIEVHPSLGCRLTDIPERLLAAEIRYELETERFGHELLILERVSSTNDEARALTKKGVPEGTVVASELQTAGRGRRGRTWQAADGEGLLFSLILRPPPRYLESGFLTLLLGAAIARAIRLHCGVAVSVKWPNDLVVGASRIAAEPGARRRLAAAEMKIGGILCERTGAPWLVAGVGINANQTGFPAQLVGTASSLRLEAERQVNRCLLLKRVMLEIERDYLCAAGGGDDLILQQARALSATIGRTVQVETESGRTLRGLAREIAADGALVLDDGPRAQRITAGDVIELDQNPA